MSNIEQKDGWVGVSNGQPKIGQFSQRSRTTKMSDIHAFTEMTGDKNPVHYDEKLAKKTGETTQGGCASTKDSTSPCSN